ncbi:hypothetical protein DFQ30_004828, partial [Apophysomyces sp. BC1015]
KLREPHYDALQAAEEFSFVDTNFRFDVTDHNGIICRKEDRDVLKKLMKEHYLLHPLIPS